MVHVAEGVLRRYLDEPAAVDDTDRTHLAGCARCEEQIDRAAQDRDVVASVLTALTTAPGQPGPSVPDVDVAWGALSTRLGQPEVMLRPVPRAHRPQRRRRSLRNPVAAGVTAALLLIGGTAAAAAGDWLPIFHTRSVAPVTVSMADVSQLSQLAGLSGLEDYGDLTMDAAPNVSQVADAAEAQRRTGLALPRTGTPLPSAVTGTPTYFVVDHQAASFVFAAAKARQHARQSAGSLPPVPKGLEGSTLKIDAGPGVAQAWLHGSGVPTLVVARVKAPTVSSRGASLQQVRDYLLSIPGIPADLAAQLRRMSADGTLPIPVLATRMSSSGTTVNGTPATVLSGGSGPTGVSGAGAAVVWVRDGLLNAVVGALPSEQLLKVANGLH